MLDFCLSHGISHVFMQVHYEKVGEGQYRLADQQAWADLLAEAGAIGVKVEALDGEGSMAFSENHGNALARLQAVLDFHLSQPFNARFSGIHYDIEPYGTTRWKSGDHKAISRELLDILAQMRAATAKADPGLTFANDIPFWYDGNEDYMIEFNGERKYLNEHIQDISDYIGIMSYRTKVEGSNSIIDITLGELAYGVKIGRPVFLSIETVELNDTPQITFFGKSEVEVASAIRKLAKELKHYPSFGGIFIHEYETLKLIGDQWDLSELN